MLHKQVLRQPKRPYNLVVRAGLWVTVISALLWAGGRLINKIAFYLPYASAWALA